MGKGEDIVYKASDGPEIDTRTVRFIKELENSNGEKADWIL